MGFTYFFPCSQSSLFFSVQRSWENICKITTFPFFVKYVSSFFSCFMWMDYIWAVKGDTVYVSKCRLSRRYNNESYGQVEANIFNNAFYLLFIKDSLWNIDWVHTIFNINSFKIMATNKFVFYYFFFLKTNLS